MDITADLTSLANLSEDLVQQDFHNFPRVDRNVPQLYQFSEGLRAKTSRFRSANNQAAATRLLAQQGFDATKLTQDVVTLEIQPSIEDVFHADTSSVEDYLKQVEESTILAAIQEAQQETVSSFEHYMEDCMAREWAANKRQLFSFVGPHTGATSTPARAGGLLPSAGGAQGAALGGGAAGAFPASARLPPKEAAYVEAIRKCQPAAAAAATAGQACDLVKELTAACKAHDDKSHETTMSSCWQLLGDILGEAKTRGVAPGQGPRFTEALLAGARKHLERGHAAYTRSTVVRHKVAAERGADPDQLREVQAFVQVKFGNRGPLDFQQGGGQDTSWIQVYYCLRNGWHDAARRAAERAHDVALRSVREGSFRGVLDLWLKSEGRLADGSPQARSLAKDLASECDRLLRDKASLKTQPRYPYMVLLCALLAGDNRALDALSATLHSLGLPPVLTTIEDYMWSKLALVSVQPAGPSPSSPLPGGFPGLGGPAAPYPSVPAYSLADLHADLNRWPPAYYSKQGKEPLLFVTVLLLSLQFQAALRFLWKDETSKLYRLDAVHLAIALHVEQALSVGGADAPSAPPEPLDLGAIVHSYGRKFVHQDSATALHYYMAAAALKGNTIPVKGALLRELLTESRDFGTLLGAGGAAAVGGALQAFVPDLEERKRLFEAVAYECQVAAQPEEAVELYLAADRPRQALAILNQQLASVMARAVEEVATPAGPATAGDALSRVLMRGRDARQRLLGAADVGSRREVEAFDQLGCVWELLSNAAKKRYDLALQRLSELAFIPLEQSRLEVCSRAAQALHPAVQDRLQDVLGAAAESLAAQRGGASRDRAFTLKSQLECLTAYANAISSRVSQAVYQRLCDAAASFM